MDFNEIIEKLEEERRVQIQAGKSTHHSDGDWLSIMIDYLGRATSLIYAGEGVNIDELIKALAVGFAWLEDNL